ncbi:MAG: VRR-NUC domain-containing protein [Methylocystis sp.]|uniref:VRR-NUC domain-containing protein n=1 Tax=Methylocystis sp. TaxID=1911079 RepID=UPI003DA4E4C1
MNVLPLPSERQVQRLILRMIGVCFPSVFVTAIPNGAHLAGNATARFKQIGALKGDGMKVGMPDLLILWPFNQGAFIEVKRPKTGRLSEEQKAVHAVLTGLGWPVATVNSPDNAYRFLRDQGAPWSGVEWVPLESAS